MAAEVLEAVRHNPGADQRLEPHVADPHVLVAPLLGMGSVVLLDDDGALPHPLEPGNMT